MENNFNPYEEESNQVNAGTEFNEHEAIELEESSFGESAGALEKLGLENVEGYSYDFAVEKEGLGMNDESEDVSTGAKAAETTDQEQILIENEEEVMDALLGSYDKSELSPEAVKATESVIGKDDRVRINRTNYYPWRAICSLLITSKSGRRYLGTGWFIAPGTVITAGHCVYLHNDGGWAKSIKVMPGRNGNQLPYGSVDATHLRSVTGWTIGRNHEYDYGAIILPSNKKLGARTGWFGFCSLSDETLRSKFLNLSGYPGDKPYGTQWYHGRGVKALKPRKIYYQIDTFGGQSGSPVWYYKNGCRYAVGIHAYGKGSYSANSATRIAPGVFKQLKAWKALGM